MKQEFVGLLAVLEKEGALCQELLSLLEQEQTILRSKNLNRLLESNKEKETCLLRLRMCDESREAIVNKLAKDLDITPESLKLYTLSQWCPDALSGSMKQCIDRLTGLLSKIQTLNAENSRIVSFSMDHVQMCISLLENMGFSEKTYQKTGQMKASEWQGRLINKEA
ncbi:MAG: flagellar protein FlgN [Deltaproteobacteria bacterium]|nr:flagellar protein FlgN [Deltaproteobacteria bacterium]MBW2306797.1 flagellar protein FlgN [Deltaproteobacteria bacterium]